MIEKEIAEEYRKRGYTVFTSGWPDILAIKDGEEPIFREVKGPNDKPRPGQAEILRILAGKNLDAKFLITETGQEVLEFPASKRVKSAKVSKASKIKRKFLGGGFRIRAYYDLNEHRLIKPIKAKTTSLSDRRPIFGAVSFTEAGRVGFSGDNKLLEVNVSGPITKISLASISMLAEQGFRIAVQESNLYLLEHKKSALICQSDGLVRPRWEMKIGYYSF